MSHHTDSRDKPRGALVTNGGLDLAENLGIDISKIVPEPLYRAGMAYLSGGTQGGFPGFGALLKDGFSWDSLLQDPALNDWANRSGFGGFLGIGKLVLANQGVKA